MDRPMREPRQRGRGHGTGTGNTVNHNVSKAQDRFKAARATLTMRAGRVRLASRFILMAILACLASIVWLSQTSTIVSLGYQINDVDKQMTQLNRQAEQLKSQIAQFENLKRIEEEARGKLGMVPVKNVVYIKVPVINADKARVAADYTEPDAHSAASPNPLLVPVNDWWRELAEMLPRQESTAAKPDAARTNK